MVLRNGFVLGCLCDVQQHSVTPHWLKIRIKMNSILLAAMPEQLRARQYVCRLILVARRHTNQQRSFAYDVCYMHRVASHGVSARNQTGSNVTQRIQTDHDFNQ